MIRFLLAATLGASYGIYGPAFELCEGRAREAGSEEYLDSEKYQIRHWDLAAPGNLAELIGKMNRIRRENPALQSDRTLHFHHVENDQLIAYSKHTRDMENIVLTIVNLDPHWKQSGWVQLGLDVLGLHHNQNFQVHDLLTGSRYLWHGARNYVELDSHRLPAHVLRIRRHIRSEQDCDYFK